MASTLYFIEHHDVASEIESGWREEQTSLRFVRTSSKVSNIKKAVFCLQTLFPIAITKRRLFRYTENFTTTKNEHFQIKNSDIFHISAQNIDCGYSLEPPHRGGSNEYPQFMFLSRIMKNNVYPCKPQFCYIKVGFKGIKII